jgi:hypothetical protein
MPGPESGPGAGSPDLGGWLASAQSLGAGTAAPISGERGTWCNARHPRLAPLPGPESGRGAGIPDLGGAGQRGLPRPRVWARGWLPRSRASAALGVTRGIPG